jgi:hypothetical protein
MQRHASLWTRVRTHRKREREREREGGTVMSEVHKVRLSRRSCMINVLSLYDSSPNVSSSDIASSKACQILRKATMRESGRQPCGWLKSLLSKFQ